MKKKRKKKKTLYARNNMPEVKQRREADRVQFMLEMANMIDRFIILFDRIKFSN